MDSLARLLVTSFIFVFVTACDAPTSTSAPTITSFTASAATITAGSSVKLTAVFANGTSSIDNGIDNSVGAVSSGVARSVSPASTTTYTLIVTNAAGTAVTSAVTVTVVPAPTITRFIASAATIGAGTIVNLTAIFANGTASIDNNTGAVTSGVAKPVSPASTTTYTLTVTNDAGTEVTSAVTVTVVPLLLTVSTVDVKTVQFNWNAYTNATSYKLYVNPDSASGFTLQTDNISGTSAALTLPVHFTDWVNATYMVEAYNSTTLLESSSAISITSEMLNTIGYAKASNPTASDLFGHSVSLSSDGNTLAVGATGEDGSSAGINGTQNDSLSGAGAVYVFTRSGTTWSQQAYVKASNPTREDIFGRSVSLSADGNTLAVGSTYEDGSSAGINGSYNDLLTDAGAVYVFTRSGSTWSQQAYVKASNPTAGDEFGRSVSVSADGNTLAVGAINEDGSSAGVNGTQNDLLTDTGAVYVFTRSGATWSQQAYVKASNPTAGDWFGHSVSVSSDGNILAVGAHYEDGSSAGINGSDNDSSGAVGAVYVFTRSGATWSQQAYVKASNPTAGDWFGYSVSVSADGNTLAVGAPNESGSSAGINGSDNDSLDNAGAVYIFTRSGATWSQQAYVKASNPAAGDEIGRSVSVSADGNTLAAGAPTEDGGSAGVNGSDNDSLDNDGAVYVFTRSGAIWSQQAYVKASNPTADDRLGVSVSVSADGNTLVVGNHGEDGSSAGVNGTQNESLSFAGAVYIY
jgi:hypothetical protein